MTDQHDLELLLNLDGARFETADWIVEFTVRRTEPTTARPHGVSYAIVLRPRGGGQPWVKFDNAHPVRRPGGRYVKAAAAFDHWHRTERDRGRPYVFTTATQLLHDFWRQVKRALDEKGLPHDL